MSESVMVPAYDKNGHITVVGAMDLVRAGWDFNIAQYPNMTGEYASLDHVLKHMAKGVGGAFALTEQADHKGYLTHEASEALRVIAIKQVINAMRLADLACIGSEGLSKAIEEWYDSKSRPAQPPVSSESVD